MPIQPGRMTAGDGRSTTLMSRFEARDKRREALWPHQEGMLVAIEDALNERQREFAGRVLDQRIERNAASSATISENAVGPA